MIANKLIGSLSVMAIDCQPDGQYETKHLKNELSYLLFLISLHSNVTVHCLKPGATPPVSWLAWANWLAQESSILLTNYR